MNKKLQTIRRHYLNIEPPEELKVYGWQAIEKQIEEMERKKVTYLPGFVQGLNFISMAIFVLVVGAGVAYATWVSNPGDTLYPVKQLSQQVILKIQPSPEPEVKGVEILFPELEKKSEEQKDKKETEKKIEKETEKEKERETEKEDIVEQSLEDRQQNEEGEKKQDAKDEVEKIKEDIKEKTEKVKKLLE